MFLEVVSSGDRLEAVSQDSLEILEVSDKMT